MKKCPAGYYCPNGGAVSELKLDEITIKICQEGFYCPEGSLAPIRCPIGTFNSKKGQSACTFCPAGYQCEMTGLTAPTDCTPGSFCPETKTIGSNNKLPCEAGTYSDKTNLKVKTECAQCPRGKYCLAGSERPSADCSEGFFCAGGSPRANPFGQVTQPYTDITQNG